MLAEAGGCALTEHALKHRGVRSHWEVAIAASSVCAPDLFVSKFCAGQEALGACRCTNEVLYYRGFI